MNLNKIFLTFFSKEIILHSLLVIVLSTTLFLIFSFWFLSSMFELMVLSFDDESFILFFEKFLGSFALWKWLISSEFLLFLFEIIVALNLWIVIYFLYFLFYLFHSILLQKKIDKYFEMEAKKSYSYLLYHIIKASIITLILSVLILPLLLVPFLQIILFLPLYYFFHKAVVFQASFGICTMREYKRITKVNFFTLHYQTFWFFLVFLIPIVGVFFYPLYLLYLKEFFMQEKVELLQANKSF